MHNRIIVLIVALILLCCYGYEQVETVDYIMFKKILIAIGIAIAGFFVVGFIANASASMQDKARWTAEKAVSLQLKDPDSAKFRDIFVVVKEMDVKDLYSVAVCGVVDGKNSYGAFTGGQRFVAKLITDKSGNGSVKDLQLEDDKRATVDSLKSKNKTTVFEKIYWNDYCVDSTHGPTYTGKSY